MAPISILADILQPRVLSAVVIIYGIVWILYCRFFHPLRNIPGPFLASISRLWMVWKTMKGDMDRTERALHAKYGYLVRIAHNEVLCSDPDAIKIIYGTKTSFKKTDFYNIWAPPNNGGYPGHFPERDEKRHAERRRIVNSVFSMSSVLDSEPALDKCTRFFCKTMREFSGQERVVDLGLWLHMFAFDVLGELFYGDSFGFMDQRADYNGYMASMDSLLPVFTIGGTVPSYLTPLVLPLTLLWPSVRGALPAIKHIESSSKMAVQKRKMQVETSEDDKRDLLRKMLEINTERGEKVNFTVPHIIIESTSSLFAGADTTAIALRSILYHLLRNPAANNTLTAELDQAAAAGLLSDPIAYAEAIKLLYLGAVIKEGMRLHPSVGLHLPREVPSAGAVISGVFIPAGYRIGINPAVVQYDRDVFGDDADCFRPERWLGTGATQMDNTMLQFGSGSRTCIGKNISLSEIYKLVPQVVLKFRLKLADPAKEWNTANYWFNKQTGVDVIVEERVVA